MPRFLLTWAGAFATVLAIFAAAGPELAAAPTWLRALILSGVMVALMQRVLGPAINGLLTRIERGRP
ncbi:MAG: hypothetical protein AAGE83_10285 [Pseudomonadota bacterium]